MVPPREGRGVGGEHEGRRLCFISYDFVLFEYFGVRMYSYNTLKKCLTWVYEPKGP